MTNEESIQRVQSRKSFSLFGGIVLLLPSSSRCGGGEKVHTKCIHPVYTHYMVDERRNTNRI